MSILIKKLAKQANEFANNWSPNNTYDPDSDWHFSGWQEVRDKKFAELIRANERKACERLCEKELHNITVLTSMPLQSSAAWTILQKIKARGEVK